MDNDKVVAIALLKGHRLTHTVTDSSATVARPRITQGMSVKSWRSFLVMWRLYKTDTDVSEAECGLQLIQCCEEKLRAQLFRADSGIFSKSEIEQLETIRKLAGRSETL